LEKPFNNTVMTIGNSGLSVRAKNCLSTMLCDESFAKNFFGMGPLSGWNESKNFPLMRVAELRDYQLLQVANFGRKTLKEFRDLTQSHQVFLLPCPFCGGNVHCSDSDAAHIVCLNSGCDMLDITFTASFKDFKKLAKQWNRRSDG
jgi:hypothetical protein